MFLVIVSESSLIKSSIFYLASGDC